MVPIVIFFLFMFVLMAVVVAPVVIFTVSRIVPRIVDRTVPPLVDRFASTTTPELDARLTRIEEAIDAMAVEIERIRAGDLDPNPQRPLLPGARSGEQGANS